MPQKPNIELHNKLRQAIAYHNTSQVKHLISLMSPADINHRDGNNAPCVVQAAQFNQTVILTLLLEKSADVNIQDIHGQTAASFAAQHNALQALATLKKHGADLNSQDSQGYTPLMEACMHENHAAIEYLLNAGVKTDSTTTYNETALYLAIENNDEKAVDILLNHGASLQINPSEDKDLLRFAEKRSTPAIHARLQNEIQNRKLKTFRKEQKSLTERNHDVLLKKYGAPLRLRKRRPKNNHK